MVLVTVLQDSLFLFPCVSYGMAAEAMSASTESWVGVAHSQTPVSILKALMPLSTR